MTCLPPSACAIPIAPAAAPQRGHLPMARPVPALWQASSASRSVSCPHPQLMCACVKVSHAGGMRSARC